MALPADVAQRRLAQRREMLGDIVLWIYAYAGTIPLTVAVVFLLCGIGLTGLFVALSEFGINERFDEHFLATPQIASNIMLQLGFLLAVPEIGYLFLSVIFVIMTRTFCMRIPFRSDGTGIEATGLNASLPGSKMQPLIQSTTVRVFPFRQECPSPRTDVRARQARIRIRGSRPIRRPCPRPQDTHRSGSDGRRPLQRFPCG